MTRLLLYMSILFLPLIVEAADCTSTLANLTATQTEILMRIARVRCRGIKENSPGTVAPYGFTDDATCSGTPTVTQMQSIICDLGVKKLQDDNDNLNSLDGRELGVQFPTLPKATRDAMKSACGTCTFLGE